MFPEICVHHAVKIEVTHRLRPNKGYCVTYIQVTDDKGDVITLKAFHHDTNVVPMVTETVEADMEA